MRGRLLTNTYPLGAAHHITVHADTPFAMSVVGFQSTPPEISPHSIQCAELFLLERVPRMRPPAGIRLLSECNATTESGSDDIVYTEHFGKAQSIISDTSRRGIIAMQHARRLNPEFLTRLIVRPVMDRLLASTFLLLHAAAVSWHGRSYIFLGDAGSGKSTILHGLLDRKMGFLGDDRVLMPHNHVPLICTYPEYIRLPRTTWGPKHNIMPKGPYQRQSVPGCVVLLSRTDAELEITRPGPAESAARIARHIIHTGVSTVENLDSIAALATDTTTYLIRGWGALQERLDAIHHLILADQAEHCHG